MWLRQPDSAEVEWIVIRTDCWPETMKWIMKMAVDRRGEMNRKDRVACRLEKVKWIAKDRQAERLVAGFAVHYRKTKTGAQFVTDSGFVFRR